MSVSDDELFHAPDYAGEGSSASFSQLFYENDRALEQYLKRLASLEPYGYEKESELWQELIRHQEEFREKLSFFAITPKYLYGLLASCGQVEELDDIFPQSLIRAHKEEDIFKWLEKLKSALQNNLLLLHESFEKNDRRSMEKARRENRVLLQKAPFLPEHAFHLYERLIAFSLYCREPLIKNSRDADHVLQDELLCTIDEFEENFALLEKLHQKIDALRHKIAEGNLRLVVSIAKPYHGKGVPFMDLIQEGNMGLMKAVDRFDFPLGHHFSTYATWWIRQSVALAQGRQSRVIRLPAHMLHTISRITRTEQHLLQEYGREPTVQEVSSTLDMSVEKVNSLKKMTNQTISLQASVYRDEEGNEAALEDRKELSDSNTPLHDLSRKVLAEKLSQCIAALPERHAAILRMRFGLDGENQRSLTEISDHFRISKERIRQIESNAIAKLRAPENLKLFEDYFT